MPPATARRSPADRESRLPISNSRTSRCSRRRLCETASIKPGSADGRSTEKVLGQRIRDRHEVAVAGKRRGGRLGDEPKGDLLGEALPLSVPCGDDAHA
jgi:hypothetical protein